MDQTLEFSFLDKCRDDVARQGVSLSAEEMTAGLKTHELLCMRKSAWIAMMSKSTTSMHRGAKEDPSNFNVSLA